MLPLWVMIIALQSFFLDTGCPQNWTVMEVMCLSHFCKLTTEKLILAICQLKQVTQQRLSQPFSMTKYFLCSSHSKSSTLLHYKGNSQQAVPTQASMGYLPKHSCLSAQQNIIIINMWKLTPHVRSCTRFVARTWPKLINYPRYIKNRNIL